MRAATPLLRALSAAALAVATALAFHGALSNGWVLVDDPVYVTNNPHVVGGLTWANFTWFLTGSHGGNWHPLTSWTHLADVSLFGRSPDGPHAVNVALHAIAAVLLAFALHALTGAWWRSLAVAALFALHPLRAESVAWVSERKDVLSGVWFSLTLLAYARWSRSPSTGRFALVCAALTAGLASKPMLVTVPALLVVLDPWPLDRPLFSERGAWLARLREKAPLFALAAACAALTWWVQRATGAMTDGGTLPLAARTANALLAPWRYAFATLWPANLGAFYPLPTTLPAWQPALAAGGLALALALAWRVRCRQPWWLAGLSWFLGMLVPVSGLVQVGRQGWADRYTYLPSIGLALPLVWGVGALVERRPRLRPVALAAFAAALLALGTATRAQVAVWRDSETLFAHTTRVVPRNPVALVALGSARVQANRPADAVAPLREALALEPANAEARDKLVFVLRALGRDEEALPVALAGLRLNASARGWYDVGQIEAKAGRDSLAVQAFANSARLDSTQWGTHAAWAEALGRLGRPREAATHFDVALRLSPPNAPLLLQSAWLRATSRDAAARDGALAIEQAERAVALAGEGLADAGAAATLAAAYAEAGRYGDAVAAADSAVAAARALGLADAAAYLDRQRTAYRAGRAWRE